VQANITIYHPDLRDMQKTVRALKPEYEDLRSKITYKASIHPGPNGGSIVNVKWKVEPILHRVREDEIITKLTAEINEEIQKVINPGGAAVT